jgi:hypothetical protein
MLERKREALTGRWGELDNVHLHKLCCSVSINRDEMHVTCRDENAYSILCENLKRRNSLGGLYIDDGTIFSRGE